VCAWSGILQFNRRYRPAIFRRGALQILNGQEMIFLRPTSGTPPKKRVLIGQTHDVLFQVKAHIISRCERSVLSKANDGGGHASNKHPDGLSCRHQL
jgi:hypothetical protein